MKNKVLAAAVFLTLVFTVSVAVQWHELSSEQQAFVHIAGQVLAKRKAARQVAGGGAFYEAGNKTDETGKADREVLPEYRDLVRENPDFAGWLAIDETVINYPVMQTPDDIEYYLHRDFKGEKSYAGTPFVGSGSLQEENGDLFLYGHNMKNGTMFATLFRYQNKNFWETHPMIRLDSCYEHREYRVFSVFQAEETEWSKASGLFYPAGDGGRIGKKREEFLKKLKQRGRHESDVPLDRDSQLLFLVTCSYGTENSRLVVAAVREDQTGEMRR